MAVTQAQRRLGNQRHYSPRFQMAKRHLHFLSNHPEPGMKVSRVDCLDMHAMKRNYELQMQIICLDHLVTP